MVVKLIAQFNQQVLQFCNQVAQMRGTHLSVTKETKGDQQSGVLKKKKSKSEKLKSLLQINHKSRKNMKFVFLLFKQRNFRESLLQ